MNTTTTNTTIEPAEEPYHDGGFSVYRHDVHPLDSKLAGQIRREFITWFPTLAEAITGWPQATVSECSTRQYIPGLDWHGTLQG